MYACTALHNYIVDSEGLDEAEKAKEAEEAEEEPPITNLFSAEVTTSKGAKEMELKRDRIAKAIWADYIQYQRLNLESN